MRIVVQHIGEDEWGRKIYKQIDTLRRYKEVDGQLYTYSKDGEPDCPIDKDIKVLKAGEE